MSQKYTPRIDERWIRHDWRMWLRPDFERWIKPGVDPADVIPALARERAEREAAEERARAAEDAELAALIEHERRALAPLNEEMKEVNAEMARRRRILAEDEAKYSPSQPRVPAGNPRGGRWTNRSEGGSAVGGFDTANAGENAAENAGNADSSPAPTEGINDPRVISDADPDAIHAGDQYAQAGRRSGTSVRINGQLIELTPGQAAELQAVQARADGAVTRVRELEPNWKPTPSAYESVDGLIKKYRADAQQAQERASELGRLGLGPGPFAGESISARGPGRDFTAAERREIDRIGSETGCHTCGTLDPETTSRNLVVDHQPPSALNWSGIAQRLYPQCASCSVRQGGYVTRFKGSTR